MIRRALEALTAYTPGEQPADAGIVKLNTNENPYPPSPAVERALAAEVSGRLRRYPDPSCAALRGAIAAEHGVTPEQVICGNGSDELLSLVLRALVEPDGVVGFLEPSYSLYSVLCAGLELQIRPLPLADDWTWTLPPEVRWDLFLLTQPNAPTGRLTPLPQVAALAAALEPAVLVLDQAYVDFAGATGLELLGERENVLVLRTFSKAYSLAGIRLGYALGPAPLIAALNKIKDSYNVNALTQRLGLAAFEDQEWMRDNAARICATRSRVAAALARRGFEVTPSQANFLWVRPPAAPATAWLACWRAAGLLVRHFPGPRTGAYLRLTIGTDAEMDRLLAVAPPA
ncbi:MAG: histidinol-phosphate transaminase [Candidatus Marinimicrobia bacterium]|nr:histidinol-phosphate transaminase [Candidatus Neomarinimicrobiota bacterium]